MWKYLNFFGENSVTTNAPPNSQHRTFGKILKAKSKTLGGKVIDFSKKLAANRYFNSIMEGFMAVMTVIITSSLFILLAEIAPAFGFKWTAETNPTFQKYYEWCYHLYNLSFGIFGLLLAPAIASKLMNKLNANMPLAKRVDNTAIVIASLIAYLSLTIPLIPTTGFDLETLGTRGILTSIIVGLVVPNIYKFCFKYNITIRLPKQVPQAISNTFLSIFPLFFSLMIFGTIGWAFAIYFQESFLNVIFSKLVDPLFKNFTGTQGFLVAYTVLFSLVWFIGIHPSVLSAIHEPIKAMALVENQQALASGIRPTNLWADPIWTSITQPGGTGATIAVSLLIILLARSKRLKVIGIASLIPGLFQVNEPLLFGVPFILNPIMVVPFLLLPMLASVIGIIFDNLLLMNCSTSALPWSMPQILSVPVGSNLQAQTFFLPISIFFLSFFGWMPFIKVQDNIYLNKEIKDDSNTLIGLNGIGYISFKLFLKDPSSKKMYKHAVVENRKAYKNKDQQLKATIAQSKIEFLKNKFQNLIHIVDDIYSQKSLKHQNRFNILVEKYNDQKIHIEEKMVKKIKEIEVKLEHLNQTKQSYIQNGLNNKLNTIDIRTKKLEQQISDLKNKPIVLKFHSDPEIKFQHEMMKSQYVKDKDLCRICQKILKQQEILNKKLIQQQITTKSLINLAENKISNVKEIKTEYRKKIEAYKLNGHGIINEHKKQLLSGIVPWTVKNDDTMSIKISVEKEVVSTVNTPLNDQLIVENFVLPKNINEWMQQKKFSKFNILVVCQGAGSSAMLANAINVGARQYSLTAFIEASATNISQASELTHNMDLIILSPQARAKQADIEALIKGTKTKLLCLVGTQYVDSIRNKSEAITIALDGLGVIKLKKENN